MSTSLPFLALVLATGPAGGSGSGIRTAQAAAHHPSPDQILDCQGNPLYPIDLALDRSGKHLYANSEEQVFKFSSSLREQTRWPRTYEVNGEAGSFAAIGTGPSGNVFVVDRSDGEVQKFSAKGKWLASFPGFSAPSDVALDDKGDMYVAENSVVNRVAKVTYQGIWLAEWRTFASPSYIALDRRGNAYASEWQESRPNGEMYVERFSPRGKVTSRWGSKGNGPGQFSRVAGIAIGGRGNVFVADEGNDRLQKFSPAGKLLAIFSPSGLTSPRGVAVDRRGYIYVLESDDARVVKLTAAGKEVSSASLATCP